MAGKTLITSALLYVNGIPHLGHLAGCLLPADAYARYRRMMGDEVLFPYATDEHGAASELGAAKEGLGVEEYTLKYHNLHRKIYEAFHISFDWIGRTSGAANAELTRQIAREIAARGYFEVREAKQMYSATDGRFLPDRYIEGTCPHCGYEQARGDQCEACTRLLSPEQLVRPRSAISGATDLGMRATKHLYLLLSKLAPEIRKWVDGHKGWNALTRGIAYKWLDEGLVDRAVSRDLSWGVKVPEDIAPDMAGKVFYVWFDAPIGYMSATKEYCDAHGKDWREWWLPAKAGAVKYVEFMGKDNVPFHTIFFPGMLIASGRPYKMVDELKGNSYLTFNGGKFSKSARRGIFADDAAMEFSETDYVRYFIMKNLPEAGDADFSFERMAEDVNKDLNDVLGNFALRVLKFYKGKFGDVAAHNPAEGALPFAQNLARWHAFMDGLEMKKAMAEMRAMWAEGNEYLDAAAPWSLYKTDPGKAGEILVYAMNMARLFATLLVPACPNLAGRVLSALGAGASLSLECEISKGHKIGAAEQMFEKITPERVEELNGKYNKG